MKLSSNFILHDSGSEHFLVTTGGGKFNGMVKNNETAAFICQCLTKETTEAEIVKKVLDRYDVDQATAESSVKTVLEKLRSIGALNE